MKKITPFLWFDDKAVEAVKYYVSIFKNSKFLGVTRNGKKVMVVSFRLDGQDFLALNGGPHFKFTPAISFSVNCKSQGGSIGCGKNSRRAAKRAGADG